ncbi:histidine kinase [Burkholderia sp. SRS-W-2-2016]|uniref:sensor histidine kinase n=1 Tax=Burkholderia sp. SRS-W-2-2016 TaxID=1926878 RepID=UPI00094ABB0B|nr:ATP-binding protein [Burkholderia sp. SRS-W-2-2016]OLL33615.1 histidine kinase [Burkholderia sp. SRS-W-2-2016]
MDTSTAVPFDALLASPAPRDGFDAPLRAAQRELEQLRARVRELSAELVDAQESVRRHIARELHDGVGAELTATRFALAGVETWLAADAPPQCTTALALANRSLDAVCAANRGAVAQLHAPSFELGVGVALRQWIDEFAGHTGLLTSFSCADDARLARLSGDAALAVFRVAQEALNNVAKHARANNVEVRIEAGARHLKLSVSDDGIGMSRGAQKKQGGRAGGHFGLTGMQARCAAFDGTLRVSARRASRAPDAPDAPQRGTLLQARFAWDALLAPLPAPRAARRALQA